MLSVEKKNIEPLEIQQANHFSTTKKRVSRRQNSTMKKQVKTKGFEISQERAPPAVNPMTESAEAIKTFFSSNLVNSSVEGKSVATEKKFMISNLTKESRSTLALLDYKKLTRAEKETNEMMIKIDSVSSGLSRKTPKDSDLSDCALEAEGKDSDVMGPVNIGSDCYHITFDDKPASGVTDQSNLGNRTHLEEKNAAVAGSKEGTNINFSDSSFSCNGYLELVRSDNCQDPFNTSRYQHSLEDIMDGHLLTESDSSTKQGCKRGISSELQDADQRHEIQPRLLDFDKFDRLEDEGLEICDPTRRASHPKLDSSVVGFSSGIQGEKDDINNTGSFNNNFFQNEDCIDNLNQQIVARGGSIEATTEESRLEERELLSQLDKEVGKSNDQAQVLVERMKTQMGHCLNKNYSNLLKPSVKYETHKMSTDELFHELSKRQGINVEEISTNPETIRKGGDDPSSGLLNHQRSEKTLSSRCPFGSDLNSLKREEFKFSKILSSDCKIKAESGVKREQKQMMNAHASSLNQPLQKTNFIPTSLKATGSDDEHRTDASSNSRAVPKALAPINQKKGRRGSHTSGIDNFWCQGDQDEDFSEEKSTSNGSCSFKNTGKCDEDLIISLEAKCKFAEGKTISSVDKISQSEEKENSKLALNNLISSDILEGGAAPIATRTQTLDHKGFSKGICDAPKLAKTLSSSSGAFSFESMEIFLAKLKSQVSSYDTKRLILERLQKENEFLKKSIDSTMTSVKFHKKDIQSNKRKLRVLKKVNRLKQQKQHKLQGFIKKWQVKSDKIIEQLVDSLNEVKDSSKKKKRSHVHKKRASRNSTALPSNTDEVRGSIIGASKKSIDTLTEDSSSSVLFTVKSARTPRKSKKKARRCRLKQEDILRKARESFSQANKKEVEIIINDISELQLLSFTDRSTKPLERMIVQKSVNSNSHPKVPQTSHKSITEGSIPSCRALIPNQTISTINKEGNSTITFLTVTSSEVTSRMIQNGIISGNQTSRADGSSTYRTAGDDHALFLASKEENGSPAINGAIFRTNETSKVSKEMWEPVKQNLNSSLKEFFFVEDNSMESTSFDMKDCLEDFAKY